MTKNKKEDTQGLYSSVAAAAIEIGVPEGLGEVLVAHPFDTVIVRLQTVGRIDFGGGEHLYKGAFDCFYKILRREGACSLYKGLTLPLFTTVPVHVINFFVYNMMSLNIVSTGTKMDWEQVMKCGAVSGGVPAPFVTPIERIKTNLQIPLSYRVKVQTPHSMVIHIFKTEGLNGFFRGTLFTLFRDSVTTAIGFFTYFYTKYHFAAHNPHLHSNDKNTQRHYKYLGILLCGAVAGFAATLPIIPVDYLKTRYQLQRMTLAEFIADLKQEADRRNVTILRLTYTGMVMFLMRNMCQYSVMFLCYEMYNEFVMRQEIKKRRKTQPHKETITIEEEIENLEKLKEETYNL